MIICLIFMAAEIVGGVMAGSLAILTDAAHLMSDVAGFGISIFAIWLGRRDATVEFSYGWSRAEVIGALSSVILIWGLTAWLVYEAILRIMTPSPVDGWIMFGTALFGLFCNIIMAKVLHGGAGGHDHGSGGHGGHGGHGDKGKKDKKGHGDHGGDHGDHDDEKQGGHGDHGKSSGHGGHGGDNGGKKEMSLNVGIIYMD